MVKNVVTLTSQKNAKIDPVVLDWARNAPQEFIECRDVTHNIVSPRPKIPLYLLWEVVNVSGRREWRRKVKCSRCKMIRIDRKDYSTGLRLNPYYEPPTPKPGQSEYYLPPGTGQLSRMELFRLTLAMGEAERAANAKTHKKGA